MNVNFDYLIHLEQNFFDAGYKDGFAHGRVHGLIEGRALGREKGFEMWEELGFYEGFAGLWLAVLKTKGDERKIHHISGLLALIAQFPSTNPSHPALSSSDPPSSDASSTPNPPDTPKPQQEAEDEVDILKLLRQIRSKYKLLCAVLGVRPRMHSTESGSNDESGKPNENGKASYEQGNAVNEDQTSLGMSMRKPKIWNVRPAQGQDLNF